MEFEKGWLKSFSAFIDKVNIFFRKRKEEQYAEYWQKFALMCMSISEHVADFVLQHDIDSPLGQILYFPTRKFSACQEQFQSLVTLESTSFTGFSNTATRIRASPFDLDLMEHIEHCSVEAFEEFNLDYNLYSLNINRFVDIMMVPDSQSAFMCVTFLAEWFELAGDQEVINKI